MSYGGYYRWRPYVSVAERRRQAARKTAALKKRGRAVDPVVIEGRKIAHTFWGAAWCDNLESYSDYANRLPRGRTYVRNGSVIDLQIQPGRVTALVSGSAIYEVEIAIKPAAKNRWRALARKCAGKIDSAVELLQGTFSKGVMKILARRDTGLFPAPREISLECSCPDWATLCKHVAAVLYGVGARLDRSPELLFVLRDVDPMDLVAQAGSGGALGEITGPAKGQLLDTGGLSDLFGIDLEEEGPSPRPRARARSKRSGRKARPSPARKTSPAKRRTPSKKRTTSRSGRSRTRNASRTRTRPRVSKRRSRKITARELLELGVPRSTFQNWVSSGVLARTDRRGVYRTTASTQERIEAALQRRRRRRRRR